MPVSVCEMYDLFPPAVVQSVVEKLTGDGFTPSLGKSWVDCGCFRAMLQVRCGNRVVCGYIAADDNELFPYAGETVYGDCVFAFKVRGEAEPYYFTVDSFYEWIKSRF